MKANVIQTSDPDMAMRMVLGGVKDNNTVQYIKESMTSFYNTIKEVGGEYLNKVKNIYNYYNNSEILNNTKRLLEVQNVIRNDEVLYPVDEETIHNPGYMMRRYIMAYPQIFDMYEKNRCSGYGDEWYNPEPEVTIAEYREDYLKAIDGVMLEDKDGNGWFKFYRSDSPLSVREKIIVNNAWDILRDKIANGVDPTSIEKEEL